MASDRQVGGDHYKQLAIQPIEYIYKNDLDYFEGNVVKYITRWRYKGGIGDLEKAKHYIDLLIEQERLNDVKCCSDDDTPADFRPCTSGRGEGLQD